jgi:hypothetical protein
MKRALATFAGAILFTVAMTGCQGQGTNFSENAAQEEQDQLSSESHSQQDSGTTFSDYHATYNRIGSVLLYVEALRLRTDDGKYYNVAFTPQLIDFTLLAGLGKGIKIDASKIQLPAGVNELDVVEVDLRISKKKNVLNFTDESSCRLKAQHRLVLYTRTEPAEIEIKDGSGSFKTYLAKVSFDKLDAIQLDCQNKHHGSTYHGASHKVAFESSVLQTGKHHHDDDGCSEDGGACELSCRLATQRLETTIRDLADEF